VQAQSLVPKGPEMPKAMKRFLELSDKNGQRKLNKTTDALAKKMTKWVSTDLDNNVKVDSALIAYSGTRGTDFDWETLAFTLEGPSIGTKFDSAATFQIANNIKILYNKTYDANNNPLTYLQQYATGTGSLTNNSKAEMTYDAQNNVLSETYAGWDASSSTWKPTERYTYAYNSNGKTLSDTTFSYNAAGSAWEPSDLSVYHYDGNGNLISGELKEWDGGAWTDWGQMVAIYDAQGNRLSGTVYDISNGQTMPMYQDSLQYNSTGGITFYQISFNNGSGFLPNYRQYRYPNTAGHPDSLFMDAYQAGNWMKYVKLDFTYDNDGDPIKLAQFPYTGNAYSPDASLEQVYYYNTSWPVGLRQVVVAQNAFSLYPNPATQSITLQTKGNQSYAGATILIGSMEGKVIYEGKTDASGQTRINLGNYTTGMYWMAVKDQQGALLYRNTFNKQ
jgi:hypothetical protein